MIDIFGVPLLALLGQMLLGLVNGSFYALLSLGLAVIFGLLNVINFAHGAFYMMGAFAAWGLLTWTGIGYFGALLLVPPLIGLLGLVVDRLLLKRIAHLDPLYGLLLTFGLALVLEGGFRYQFGVSGESYEVPESLQGALDVGFMVIPKYRLWVIVVSTLVCLSTWLIIEKTRLGSYLRAATENPTLTQAFGINVPLMISLTYGFGVALAGLAGVMAAPIFQVAPLMGSNLIIVVFAVVVIGGMGSILGSVVTGLGLGLVEGLTKVYWPEASSTVVFVLMALVLVLRPAGLFGRSA